MKRLRFGVIFRVFAGLAVMGALILAASAVSIQSFSDLRKGLNDFTKDDLPNVIDGSNLNQLSVNLASFAPALLAVDSPGTRKSVQLRIKDQASWLDEILSNLKASGIAPENLTLFQDLKEKLVQNLSSIAELVKQRNLLLQQMRNQLHQVAPLNSTLFELTHKATSFSGDGSAQTNLQNWQILNAELLVLAPLAATTNDELELTPIREKAKAALSQLKTLQHTIALNDQPELEALNEEIATLVFGQTGIISLQEKILGLNLQVQGTLSQNKLIADRFVASSSILTRAIRKDILTKSEQLDYATQQRSLYFLMISFLCIAGAFFVFIYINKSVIQRLRALQKNMLRHADGDESHIVVSGNDEITDMAKAFKFFVGSIKKTEEALRLAKDAAERADQAKSRFIAAASHDLRQPLHAIGLFVAELQDRSKSTGLEGTVGNIERSVDHMNDLFESILDFSQLETSKLTPELSSVRLSQIFREMEKTYGLIAQEKGLELTFVYSSRSVLCDPLMLNRIMRNLLSNAIRYTPTGKVLCGIRLTATHARIEIHDTGMGVSDNVQQKMFTDFYRGETAEKQDKGLGLGLSIAAQMARLLETQIEVNSILGQGSCFSLSLPLSEPMPLEANLPQPAVPTDYSLAGETVLILDDDEQVLRATRDLLERWGCHVIAVQNVTEATQQLQNLGDNVLSVITDLQLGADMDGVDFLNQYPSYQNRAIVISGNSDPSVAHRVKSEGYLFFKKPLRPAKLASLLRHIKRQIRS